MTGDLQTLRAERVARRQARQRVERANAREMRRACWRAVYRREKGRCQRCSGRTSPRFPVWHPRRAHVNELVPRSKGGSPYDASNCELVCQACHLPNGAHAPTAERQRRLAPRRMSEWP